MATPRPVVADWGASSWEGTLVNGSGWPQTGPSALGETPSLAGPSSGGTCPLWAPQEPDASPTEGLWPWGKGKRVLMGQPRENVGRRDGAP